MLIQCAWYRRTLNPTLASKKQLLWKKTNQQNHHFSLSAQKPAGKSRENLSVSSSYLHWTSSGIERATTFSFCCSFREQHWSGELVNFIRLKFLVPAFQELQGYGKVYICQNNCILLHWIYEPTQPPTSPSCCSREDRKIVPSF